jgi:hypothetical protein
MLSDLIHIDNNTCNRKYLILQECYIDNKVIPDICNLIINNSTTRYINMSDINISNKGGLQLIRSLYNNKTVLQFNLDDNNVSQTIIDVIHGICYRNNSLRPINRLLHIIIKCKEKILCRLVIYKILDWLYKIELSWI